MNLSPWPKYNEAHEGREPFALLVRAVREAPDRESALDLGAGPLNDVRFLLTRGFMQVTVVDNEDDVTERVARLADNRINMQQTVFQNFNFPIEKFSLVNAVRSLPFTPPDAFSHVFQGVKNSLKPGGIFVGNLFGVRHAFSANKNMTFLEERAARELFADMDVLTFNATEEERETKDGVMHWHTFDFIARKR